MRDIAATYLANFIKTGDPNGHDVPHWVQVDDGSGGQFLRFHEGEAEMRTSTPYPTRDAYLRRKVLDGIGMDEADLRKVSRVPTWHRLVVGMLPSERIRFVAWGKILHKLTLVLRNFTPDHGRGLVGFHYRRRTSCEFLPL